MSDLIIKQGHVTLRGLMDSTKQISLCRAKSLQDIQLLFEQLFVIDKYKPIHTKTLPWLGHITKAAAEGTIKLTRNTVSKYQEWIRNLDYITQLIKEKSQIKVEGWMQDLPEIENEFVPETKSAIERIERPKLPADFETFILYHESQRSPTVDVSF
ncbi:hypothetical protein HK103_001032 [Boothiomyces macroporosus]|uniref:Uncharacterized protein n=1 Tax=Boothiomyces macroporosus TaxID=261099 RepID=A0AAD5UB90_9FUNG|nr:hypothetical protein HK103_001032 [Boothiomyces macroporosus]